MAFEVRAEVKQIVKKPLSQFWADQVRGVFNNRASEAVEELRRGTPEGATGQLAAGWDYVPARKSAGVKEFRTTIVNTAENAQFRIVGRGPGKFPPGAPIEAWVKKKVGGTEREVKSLTYLIRRKIAREGTERWKAKENWAGLQPNGKFGPDSPVAKAQVKIAADLKALKIK